MDIVAGREGKSRLTAALSVVALFATAVAVACSGPATTTAESTASPPTGQPSPSASQSGAATNPPMPTDSVAAEGGKTYAVGDAIRIPENGVVIRVTRVRFNSTAPGLGPGRRWIFVDLTLANTSAQMVTVRPIGDLGIRLDGDTKFHTEPILGSESLEDSGIVSPMENTDIPPGHAVARVFTVGLAVDAKHPTLWYKPGLIAGPSLDRPPIKIALGS